MQLLPLLGRQLKDDHVIDVLEGFDMEVWRSSMPAAACD
jgi:hypothetical protein